MPYALGLYLYLFVADIVLVVLALWLSPFGRVFNITFVLAAAYLTFVFGRRALSGWNPWTPR
jgi:hypothetical protein